MAATRLTWVDRTCGRGTAYREARGVRIWFDAPDDLVLLSDFMDWHLVLNWSLHVAAGRDGRSPGAASWTKIFNVDESEVVQACLPYLRGDWVRGAREFVAR